MKSSFKLGPAPVATALFASVVGFAGSGAFDCSRRLPPLLIQGAACIP